VDKTKECLAHIQKLLHDKQSPELPKELAEEPLLIEIHNALKMIREVTQAFSTGDLSASITAQGFIQDCLKTFQSNLRHLIWQVQMVERGDFSQQVYFMGEFSVAFNSMVQKLQQGLTEIKKQGKILKESEARFRFLASHDSLTGVYNRRSFIELAEVDLIDAADRSVSCCLAMMDIDHFKNFNDTYGHLAGDEALRHVARTVEESLRKNDFMGRYGGEEFIIFFYNADEETGLKIVERLRKNLAEKPVQLENGPVSIHASFGVTGNRREDPRGKDYIEKLINNADTALYAAKKAGRNMVKLYEYTADKTS